MPKIYAKILNHFQFKYHLTSLLIFIMFREDNGIVSEVELLLLQLLLETKHKVRRIILFFNGPQKKG